MDLIDNSRFLNFTVTKKHFPCSFSIFHYIIVKLFCSPRQLSSLEERLTSDVATILDLLHQTAGRGSTVQQAREVGKESTRCPQKMVIIVVEAHLSA